MVRSDAKEINSLNLARANGSVVSAIWREPPFWNREIGRAIDAPAVDVDVAFQNKCISTRLYDPLGSDQAIDSVPGGARRMGVRDHVLLLECVSAGGSAK
jgi:hypothetical protein